MSKRFTLGVLSELAKRVGGSSHKWTGTRTNINFLGTGPTTNPLFQGPLEGLEGATLRNIGNREEIVRAVNDAMGYYTAGKLNTIQTEILGMNLAGIDKVLNPRMPFMGWRPKIIPDGKAEGGLAAILPVPRSGYYKGRAVKSLMGLVNKRFGKGTLKRATEVDRPIYAQTFDDIESFRGKIDDNIIEEIYAMDPPQQLKAIESVKEYLLNMKNLRQGQMLEGFDVTGRLPSASGGLAKILEV